MASEIDICNLALARLGDDATISSISPPEGSPQAGHAARFYPIARDALLEMHTWSFATRRVSLAALASESWNWSYAYARPTGAIRVLSVLPPDASSEQDSQPYETEGDTTGSVIILTNQEQATLRYIHRVTDTTKFSPLFVDSLSWLLAAYMAGPILKGDAGKAESKACMQFLRAILAEAKISDANQHQADIVHTPDWIGAR